MTNLLIKIFIRNGDDVNDPKVRSAYGMFAGFVGICTNVLLAGGKIAVGLVCGSIAILADGINNLTDAGSSIVTLAGFKLAKRPGDKEHPFGHARYEYIAGLVISIVILLFAVQLIQNSVDKMLHPQALTYSIVAMGILIASILLKLWQCLFYRNIGRRIKSATVKAAAVDSRNDVITTAGVLLSFLLVHWTGWILIDGIMGTIVGIFILCSGISLIKETSSPLLGRSPDRELIDSLKEKILSYDGVLGMHDLIVHEYGQGQIFATVHLEISSAEDPVKSHDIIDNIEREVQEESGIHLVIHMDPVNTTDPQTLHLKEKVRALLAQFDESLSFHDFRVVVGYTHTNLIFDVLLPAESPHKEDELKEELAYKISRMEKGKRYFAVITVDRDYQ